MRHDPLPTSCIIIISYSWLANPLYFFSCAVSDQKLSHVEYLLMHGTDPNANLRGCYVSTIEVGAMKASLPVLDLLLAHGAILDNRDVLGFSASRGHLDVIKYFLDKGVAINAIPDNGHVPENSR